MKLLWKLSHKFMVSPVDPDREYLLPTPAELVTQFLEFVESQMKSPTSLT